MKDFELELEGDRFTAGDTIRASVRWFLDTAPESCLAHLLWYTSGIGEEVIGIVERQRFDQLELEGHLSCAFIAPPHPPSLTGTLVSLHWVVEALLVPTRTVARCGVTIAPKREAIELHSCTRSKGRSVGPR